MRQLLVIPCLVLLMAAGLRADLPLPPQVLDPQTAAEAWNVIRLSTANVDRLLREQRLDEVPQQIALCSPALRTLARSVPNLEKRPLVDEQTTLAFRQVNDIAQSGMSRLQQNCEAVFARLQATLAALRPAYAAEDVSAEIHTCPQHPEMVTPDADAPCRFCGGPLRIRRIPYTDLYAVPEVPQTQLRLEKSEVRPGCATTLVIALQTTAGRPLTSAQLIPDHAAAVRVLLVDQALSDFHLLTPIASSKPGDFLTSFKPAKTGPYRLWAELVPEETAIAEHPFGDVGGEFKIVDRSRHDFLEALGATVEGITFQLTFAGGNGGSPKARQVSMMRLSVADAGGQPITRLEPFMNAFAQLTGIYDDGRTLLRLHPVGGDILRDDLRGGPVLSFKVYPPQPGFIRFFAQVRVDGRILTAPLGVHIVP